MKELFYFVLSILIIIILIGSVVTSKKRVYEMPKEIHGLVVDKTDEYIIQPSILYILQNDSVKLIYCYEILYNKYEVGDTIL